MTIPSERILVVEDVVEQFAHVKQAWREDVSNCLKSPVWARTDDRAGEVIEAVIAGVAARVAVRGSRCQHPHGSFIDKGT